MLWCRETPDQWVTLAEWKECTGKVCGFISRREESFGCKISGFSGLWWLQWCYSFNPSCVTLNLSSPHIFLSSASFHAKTVKLPLSWLVCLDGNIYIPVIKKKKVGLNRRNVFGSAGSGSYFGFIVADVQLHQRGSDISRVLCVVCRKDKQIHAGEVFGSSNVVPWAGSSCSG